MLKTVSSITNAIGALNYKGAWNASTNTPTLVSGAGTKGDYYQVSVAGSTAIDGISNWGVGDVIAFNGTTWQRIEGGADLNGVNLSVSGVADFAAGTAINPSITITGDTDTGVFSPSANNLAISTNGTERVRVNEVGNVGFGTSSPAQQIHSTGDQILGLNKKLSFSGSFIATTTPKINLTLSSTSAPRISFFIHLLGYDNFASNTLATTFISGMVGGNTRTVSVVNSTGANTVASATIALSGSDLVITLTVNANVAGSVGYTNMMGYVDIIESQREITAVSVSG